MSLHSSFSPDPARVLAAALDAFGAAAFTVDLHGRIHSWNSAAAGLLGYTPDTIVGRDVSTLLRSEDFTNLAGRGERVAATDDHAALVAADGRVIRAALTIAPIDDDRGTVVGYLVLARSNEDRIKSELWMQFADARWHALIDAAVDGMIVIDAKGAIEAFNPAAERMFGHRGPDVLGENVRILMPSPDRERHDQYLARYLETGAQKIIGIGRDVTAIHRDGTCFPVHLSVGEMRVAGETHFVGIVHDLSARAKLEERVREQASLARLGEMAAVLAHEVKNPLAAVRGAIQVLGKRYSTDARDAEVVKEILTRLDGLNALVQDLLLFARVPEPRPVPIELRRLLAATTELLAEDPLFANVQIELEGDAPPIAVDPNLLKIAFQNILLNAAQAQQGQGRIAVSISAGESRQVVAFADQGPGIPAEARARLFQPFFTTKARGTGLGLATVRRLVHAHGGEVSVDNPPRGGTVVTIDLPAMPPPASLSSGSATREKHP